MASREFSRPDPDELLRKLEDQEALKARGRLKIFFGYAPHVGKSLRMFDEGRRRALRGQDVVVGSIQIKGLDEVQRFICDLEVIPCLEVGAHRALNVDAILKRAPQICLIDALACDNPPGSRNRYRWQDVEELRASGIAVISALNLQFVAEQQDAVERITGNRASRSIPQEFLQSADEIVVLDVDPDAAGTEEKLCGTLNAHQLSELRELALLLAAQVVEDQLLRYMNAHGLRQSWGTQERLLVCVTPRANTRAMLESGARAANRFHAHLTALYVEHDDLTREAQENVDEYLEYARQLGAEVHTLKNVCDPVQTIVEYAREQRITQVFIGQTPQSAWKIWASNPVDRLIKAAEGMDVRVFPNSQPA